MFRRIEVNPGEWFAVSDKVILVRETESVLANTAKLGTSDNHQIAYMFTYSGKLNNQDAKADVTVMMSPEDAFAHASQILEGIDFLLKENGGR